MFPSQHAETLPPCYKLWPSSIYTKISVASLCRQLTLASNDASYVCPTHCAVNASWLPGPSPHPTLAREVQTREAHQGLSTQIGPPQQLFKSVLELPGAPRSGQRPNIREDRWCLIAMAIHDHQGQDQHSGGTSKGPWLLQSRWLVGSHHLSGFCCTLQGLGHPALHPHVRLRTAEKDTVIVDLGTHLLRRILSSPP